MKAFRIAALALFILFAPQVMAHNNIVLSAPDPDSFVRVFKQDTGVVYTVPLDKTLVITDIVYGFVPIFLLEDGTKFFFGSLPRVNNQESLSAPASVHFQSGLRIGPNTVISLGRAAVGDTFVTISGYLY